MTMRTYGEAALQPNLRSAISGHDQAETGRINSLTSQFFRDLAPRKTWAAISELLDLTPRTARHRLDGTRDYTAAEIARILHSKHGGEYLALLMTTTNKPYWYRVLEPLMELAGAQDFQKRAQRKIARVLNGAIDADEQIESQEQGAMARLVSDPDFHSQQIEAARAFRRQSNRAVGGKINGRRK